VLLPSRRSRKAPFEAICLATLKAQSFRRGLELRVRSILSPWQQGLLLDGRQAAALAGCQGEQRGTVILDCFLDELGLRCRGSIRVQVKDLIDNIQLPVVMNDAAGRVQVRIHAGPERDRRRKPGRTGEQDRLGVPGDEPRRKVGREYDEQKSG